MSVIVVDGDDVGDDVQQEHREILARLDLDVPKRLATRGLEAGLDVAFHVRRTEGNQTPKGEPVAVILVKSPHFGSAHRRKGGVVAKSRRGNLDRVATAGRQAKCRA